MAERLFQVGIKAIILNTKGHVLLLQSGGPAGRWDIPGGRMDEGEDFEQTLARELTEEIGTSHIGTPEHVLSVVSNITIPVGTEQVGLILMAYRAQIPEGTTISLDDHETDFGWFAPADAAERLRNKYPPVFTDMIATLE